MPLSSIINSDHYQQFNPFQDCICFFPATSYLSSFEVNHHLSMPPFPSSLAISSQWQFLLVAVIPAEISWGFWIPFLMVVSFTWERNQRATEQDFSSPPTSYLHCKTFQWCFHEIRKSVLSARKVALPPSVLKGKLTLFYLKAEFMALVSGSKLPLLKKLMLEVHLPSSHRFATEALFLIPKERKRCHKEQSHPAYCCHFLEQQHLRAVLRS